MGELGLFGEITEPAVSAAERTPTRPQDARVVKAVRTQMEMVPRDLESLLALDHPARAIWDMLDRLDLDQFYEGIRSVHDEPGRPASDPKVLLGLWMLATVEGVGSARQLARLCQDHDAFRWMCGRVPVNYHLLSDFRVSQGKALDELLTQTVAALMAAKAVTLEKVAQDGMRVRASAGSSSYRRAESLKECLAQARQQVEQLAQQREHPDSGVTKRELAAQERAKRERVERVEQALACLPELKETKERQKKSKAHAERERITAPRASTTDPDARIMKMADGGFRPAYNIELATDAASGVIVGTSVVNAGADARQAPPMEQQVAERTGHHPDKYLMDGGFSTREDITILEQRGVSVYAPVRLPKSKPEDQRYLPRERDTPEVIQWRERMATDEAKEIYRERGQTAEWVNAQFRNRHHVQQFTVRGLTKVTAVVLLVALTHNLLRWLALSPTLNG